jgi:S1-C subfamily serine protease
MNPNAWNYILLAILLLLIFLIIVSLVFSQNTSQKLQKLKKKENVGVNFKQLKNCTCTIFAGTDEQNHAQIGSGFFASSPKDKHDVFVVTCAHILMRNVNLEVSQSNLMGKIDAVVSNLNGSPGNNRQLSCKIYAIDPVADVALLKLDENLTKKQHCVEWGVSDELQIGDPCYIIGNPLGTDFCSVSSGVVRDNRYVCAYNSGSVESLYTTVSTLPGNSGSPVFNKCGKLVGISTWVSTKNAILRPNFSGGPNQTVLQKVFEKLALYGDLYKHHKAFVGISDATVLPGLMHIRLKAKYPAFAQSKWVTHASGIVVREVYPQSPADLKGIKADDIFLSLENVTDKFKIVLGCCDQESSPSRLLCQKEPGEVVRFEVLRPSTGTTFFCDIELTVFPTKENRVYRTKAIF